MLYPLSFPHGNDEFYDRHRISSATFLMQRLLKTSYLKIGITARTCKSENVPQYRYNRYDVIYMTRPLLYAILYVSASAFPYLCYTRHVSFHIRLRPFFISSYIALCFLSPRWIKYGRFSPKYYLYKGEVKSVLFVRDLSGTTILDAMHTWICIGGVLFRLFRKDLWGKGSDDSICCISISVKGNFEDMLGSFSNFYVWVLNNYHFWTCLIIDPEAGWWYIWKRPSIRLSIRHSLKEALPI